MVKELARVAETGKGGRALAPLVVLAASQGLQGSLVPCSFGSLLSALKLVFVL